MMLKLKFMALMLVCFLPLSYPVTWAMNLTESKLIVAISNNDVESVINVVKGLEGETAEDVNQVFEKGVTPLCYAVNERNFVMVSLLINLGADMQAQVTTDNQSVSVLQFAKDCQDPGLKYVVKLLEAIQTNPE